MFDLLIKTERSVGRNSGKIGLVFFELIGKRVCLPESERVFLVSFRVIAAVCMSDCCEACFPALSRAARFPALKLSFYVRVFERKYSFFSRSPEFFCLTVSLSGFSSVILNPS